MHENHPALKPTLYIDELPLLKLLRPGTRQRAVRTIAITVVVLLLAGGALGLAQGSGVGDEGFGACACDVTGSDETC